MVVLQFYDFKIIGACYLFEMVGDMIQIIMLSFLKLCTHSFLCIVFLSVC